MNEIKKIIISDIKRSGKIRNNGEINSVGTLLDLQRGGIEQQEKGSIRNGGYLLAEQNNLRLKNADNNFPLYSKSILISTNPFNVTTEWKVKSVWDYDSFETQAKKRQNLVTRLPLPENRSLRLPDGLSYYLTEIGLAQEFEYTAEWDENWSFQ